MSFSRLNLLSIITALMTFAVVTPSLAQVAVTIGVQEVYDSNIFLENGERRPNAFVANSVIEDDIADGQLSIRGGDANDGKEDSDFITNVFIGASGDFEKFTSLVNSGWDAQVGMLVFGEYSELNRLTLDAALNLNLSDVILPKPYYVGSNISLSSQTQNISVAQGASARSSQFLSISAETGVREVELSSQTFFAAGYTGSYNVFLGQLFLSSSDENDPFEEMGSDSHSHILSTQIAYQVNRKFRTGIVVRGGTTLFTNVEGDDGLSESRADARDIYTGELAWTNSYAANERLTFNSSIGLNLNSFVNDVEPQELSVINEEGEIETVLVEREDSEVAVVFNAGLSYLYQPGSFVNLALAQERSTDFTGRLITTRTFSANVTQAFGDRFSVTGGGTYLQFSSDNSLSEAIDRVEGSLSLNYLLTQNTSLVLGYNYTVQNADDSNLEEAALFNTRDYDGSRIFIGINSGILGLPG